MAAVDGILIASLKSQIGMLEVEVERLKEGGCRFDCRGKIKDGYMRGYLQGFVEWGTTIEDRDMLHGRSLEAWSCDQSER